MDDWAATAAAALARAEPCALVSVLAVEGSAPRGAGTRMAVTREAIGGTIGGGALEMQAIHQARAALEQPAGAWRVQDYPLGPLLGQCCGGRVRLMVEHLGSAAETWIGQAGVLATRFEDGAAVRRLLDPKAPVPRLSARGEQLRVGDEIVERLGVPTLSVMLFGAGHVGQALATILSTLPINLAWFDCREEEGALPGVAFVDRETIASCASAAAPETAVLIMTHDHALDYELTKAALEAKSGFVGLIGSATKRARFLSRLAKDEVDTTRLTCPIGIEGVVGKAPAIIAVAVAAQLMQLYGAAA
jgi:xanthine dehydrogenase accessory factor